MELTLAVILPTYNERDNIAPLIERIEEALGPSGWEVIIVDDDSPDGTGDKGRELALQDARVRVLERYGRRGLASAAIEGGCATAAPFMAVMDADHQHEPALLPQMLQAVRERECDIAVGSRFVAGGSADGLSSDKRERQSRLAIRLTHMLTGVDMRDPMSGYFLMRTEQFRAQVPELSGIGFKILLDLLASADPPYTVKEIPLQFAERRAGDSKLDHTIAFEFFIGLYEKSFGKIIPVRYALFGTVGAAGVAVHMLVLALLFRGFGDSFAFSQSVATFVAMSFNFWLNNWLTYYDQRLRGWRAMLTGWAGFCLTCSIGALANVGVASWLQAQGISWVLAALSGIIVGSVWNYALSNRFVWGRY